MKATGSEVPIIASLRPFSHFLNWYERMSEVGERKTAAQWRLLGHGRRQEGIVDRGTAGSVFGLLPFKHWLGAGKRSSLTILRVRRCGDSLYRRLPMLRSFLIGLVAGQRGITPLAVIATATRRGEISPDLPFQKLMLNPVVAAGTAALAAAEMAGDKMKSEPDRTVPVGLAVRSVTAAYAGAAMAPRGKAVLGAAIAVGAALASSYVGLTARKWAMRRYGQTTSGFIEDAIVFGTGLAIANPCAVAK